MKKMLLLLVLMLGALAFSVRWFTTSVSSEIDEVQNKYKQRIGTKYVLEKDTLTVVDYSLISETFTLSNGKVVNASLILKQN